MRILLLTMAFWLLTALSHAQQFPFLKWSTTEGLAQSQVRCIAQDHLGYLWIGTLGGVSRFDGRTFKNYSRRDGLFSNQISQIASLGDSMMVFASIGGITLFDGEHFEALAFPESFASAQVNHLFETNEPTGHLLIATESGILQLCDSLRIVYHKAGDEPLNVKRILVEPSGELMVVTRNALLRATAPGLPLQAVLGADRIDAIVLDGASDGDGGWLLATIGKGLLHYRDGRLRSYGVEHGLVSENITGITAGVGRAEFWVKSRDGFSRVVLGHEGSQAPRIRTFDQSNGLDVGDIRAIFVDRENTLWLGSYGGGIRKFAGTAMSHYTSQHGLAGDIVMSVLADADGDFWFATYDNGISHKRGDRFINYGLSHGLPNTRVWSSVRDHDHRLWFGTSGGIGLYTGEGFKPYTTLNGLPHNHVLSLVVDREGRLWAGTARGLARYVGERDRFESVEGTADIRVRGIVHTSGDSLWLASSTGVHLVFNGDRVSFTETDGLPDNSVFCIVKAPDGRLWAGTEGGLGVIDARAMSIEPRYLEGGFGANHVNFIAFDSEANAWVGTNDGVFIGAAEGANWLRLGKHDGVSFLESNQNAVLITDSLVWFGTGGALTRIDRNRLASRRNITEVNVHIDQVRINLVEPDFSRYGEHRAVYGRQPADLIVPYTDNHFGFHFAALSMRDPDNLRYQYMLVGLDDDWEIPTESDFISYARLGFGTYSFKVRAVDAAGAVSAETAFTFTIRPPLWLRWWFIVFEVGALIALGALIVRWRKKVFLEKIERDQLELKSKMLSLEQQSLNSSMNRHFIFNALNAIQYYINRQDRLSANRYLSSFAKLIRKNLDSSQMNFATLNEELERLNLYLQLEKMRFADRFDYTITVDDAIDGHSVKLPSMLLQPFLENSIWHGILPKEGNGTVCVDVCPHGQNAMRVSVTDDGIGFNTSMRNKTGDSDHISRGMDITSGRLELLRKATGKELRIVGPEELRTADGAVCGTRVEIILPLDLGEN